MARGRPPKSNEQPTPETYWDKLSKDTQSKQSKLSMVLGALIILVVGVLVFNYFSKDRESLGPAQQTQQQAEDDISPEQLPGKYKIKQGDTLFAIAEKYYQDGYKYTEIAKANNLNDPDAIDQDQILQIPAPTETVSPSGDSEWGPKITSETYTVVEGDWLSKIAGRAYGDIFAYDKIAKANNIPNPDLIEPGMVLTIPR